ncbi:MAG: PEP-CTERM sorting domain-containing protein [Desulfomonilaceae bacterium]
MSMKLLTGVTISLLLVANVGTDNAFATPLNLDEGDDSYGVSSGIGSGRGILFYANESFTFNSVSLYANLGAASYDVDIYASTGLGNYGELLATASATLEGTELEYQTIDISYSFTEGHYYFLNWTKSDDSWIYGSMLFLRDSSLPINYGVLTLLDGSHGSTNIDFSNTLHGQFSFDVAVDESPVPEPSTIVLFGTGIIGIAGISRRKKFSKV